MKKMTHTFATTAGFAVGFFSSSEESLLSSLDDSCFFCGAALAAGLAATGVFLAGSSSESLSLSDDGALIFGILFELFA